MVRKSTFEKFHKQKNKKKFIQNTLYFVSKSVKCILWQIFNEIVENQDLYRNKDDFRFFFNKKFLYFDLKYFIFCK